VASVPAETDALAGLEEGYIGADGVDDASDFVAGGARELKAGPVAFLGERVRVADAAGVYADANVAGAGIGEFFFDELERTAGGGDLHGTAFYWWHGAVFSCALDGAAMGKLQKSWLKLVESAGRDLRAGLAPAS
jgi:hypothetical protein